jgi:hypothetical protein
MCIKTVHRALDEFDDVGFRLQRFPEAPDPIPLERARQSEATSRLACDVRGVVPQLHGQYMITVTPIRQIAPPIQHSCLHVAIARKSALIYLPLSMGAALLFLVAASADGYPTVARVGGTVWVGLLSLIVSMPIVISRVKKQGRNASR